MVCKTFPILRKISFVRDHQQKTLIMLSGFSPFKFEGLWGFSDFVKKGKFVTKIFLSDNAE